MWRQNEWMYLGRSSKGSVNVKNIRLRGKDKSLFKLSGFRGGKIKGGNYDKFKVSFSSKEISKIPKKVNAEVVIELNKGDEKVVRIINR